MIRIALLICLLCLSLASFGAESSRLNVRDFGAKGDGKTDDTAAFQTALDAASKANGGTVFASTGNYLIKTHLTIPANVTLEGIWEIPTAWTQNKGTTLLAVEDKGKADGTPFITMAGSNPTLKGVTIFYPEQLTEGDAPLPYPWTIQGGGDNHSIIDVLIVNPYQAVDLTGAGRHYVRNLYGQPFYKGIYVDQIYDVGRIENVHFWPFAIPWSDKGISKWQQENGTAFVFGRTDWQYVLNPFCFGYKIGYQFIATEHGGCNGSFLGIGADSCMNAVQVDECAPYGLLITNGEFVGMIGKESNGLLVRDTNTGLVSLQNCAYWGPSNRIATIGGKGAVTFTGCNFMHWDKNNTGQSAISINGGRLTVNGCYFEEDKPAVEIAAGTKSAVVTSNTSVGKFEVKSSIGPKAQIGLNAGE
jgi:hypothetical protein